MWRSIEANLGKKLQPLSANQRHNNFHHYWQPFFDNKTIMRLESSMPNLRSEVMIKKRNQTFETRTMTFDHKPESKALELLILNHFNRHQPANWQETKTNFPSHLSNQKISSPSQKSNIPFIQGLIRWNHLWSSDSVLKPESCSFLLKYYLRKRNQTVQFYFKTNLNKPFTEPI